jgi:hypothetical protein
MARTRRKQAPSQVPPHPWHRLARMDRDFFYGCFPEAFSGTEAFSGSFANSLRFQSVYVSSPRAPLHSTPLSCRSA